MSDLDSFAAHVKLFAPGCPDETMYYGIRQAAIDFCERTRMWRSEDEFKVSASDNEVLAAQYGSEIFEIESVRFDGKILDPVSVSWLDDNWEDWRDGVPGVPHYYTQTEPDTIILVPGTAGTVQLSIILKPSQDTEQLPDWMASKYRETIANGALARILMIPNQSFSNPEMAMARAQMFEMSLAKYSTQGLAGQQKAPKRTKATFY